MRMFFARPAMLVLLSLAGSGSHAAENIIQISQQNFENLGVKLGKPETVSQFPVLSAPANVVIPPAQEYMVSAAQAGVIHKLNVAIGDKVVKGQVLAQLNSPDLLTLQKEYLKADNTLQLVSAIYQRDKKTAGGRRDSGPALAGNRQPVSCCRFRDGCAKAIVGNRRNDGRRG